MMQHKLFWNFWVWEDAQPYSPFQGEKKKPVLVPVQVKLRFISVTIIYSFLCSVFLESDWGPTVWCMWWTKNKTGSCRDELYRIFTVLISAISPWRYIAIILHQYEKLSLIEMKSLVKWSENKTPLLNFWYHNVSLRSWGKTL